MCRRMCRLASILLNHQDKSAFIRSPWFEEQTPFLVYRGLAAIFTFLVLQGNMVALNITSNFGWFFKFTHWGFVALTAHMGVAAAICLVEHVQLRGGNDEDAYDATREHDDFYRQGSKMEEGFSSDKFSKKRKSSDTIPDEQTTKSRMHNSGPLPWYIKLDWALYNIACTHALTISTVYYSSMAGDLSTNSFLLHSMNSVLVVIEVLLCGIPTRVAHVIYPILFLVTYLIFVYQVSSMEGLKKYGQVYIFLDFAGKTKRTIYMVVAMLVFIVPAFHLVIYVLYRCRVLLLRVVKRVSMKELADHGQMDAQTQTEPTVSLTTV